MAGEDLTADEIAERLMKMLDTKDPGARKLAAVSSATVDKGPSVSRMKLDSLLTLQNVNRLLQFVRARQRFSRLKLRVHAGIPYHGSGYSRGIVEQSFVRQGDNRGAHCFT